MMERDHLEGIGIDRGIILKWILTIRLRGMDWIKLAEVRDRWQAVVNTIMKLELP
jgi:hypothetical protein